MGGLNCSVITSTGAQWIHFQLKLFSERCWSIDAIRYCSLVAEWQPHIFLVTSGIVKDVESGFSSCFCRLYRVLGGWEEESREDQVYYSNWFGFTAILCVLCRTLPLNIRNEEEQSNEMHFYIHLEFTPMETIELEIPELNAQRVLQSHITRIAWQRKNHFHMWGSGEFSGNCMWRKFMGHREEHKTILIFFFCYFCYFSICRITLEAVQVECVPIWIFFQFIRGRAGNIAKKLFEDQQ